jgi:hypothetical protein
MRISILYMYITCSRNHRQILKNSNNNNMHIFTPIILSLLILTIEEWLTTHTTILHATKRKMAWQFTTSLGIIVSGMRTAPHANNIFITTLKTKSALSFQTNRRQSYIHELKARINFLVNNKDGSNRHNVINDYETIKKLQLLTNDTIRFSYLAYGDWALNVYSKTNQSMVISDVDAYTLISIETIVVYVFGLILIMASFPSFEDAQLFFIALIGCGVGEIFTIGSEYDISFPEYRVLSWLFPSSMIPHEKLLVVRHVLMGFASVAALYYWRKRDEKLKHVSLSLTIVKAYQDKAIDEMVQMKMIDVGNNKNQ